MCLCLCVLANDIAIRHGGVGGALIGGKVQFVCVAVTVTCAIVYTVTGIILLQCYECKTIRRCNLCSHGLLVQSANRLACGWPCKYTQVRLGIGCKR